MVYNFVLSGQTRLGDYKMKRFALALRLTVPIVMALLAPYLAAQTVAGSISGLVTDPSGSAIAGASVVVTDIDRNVNIRAISNESGFYLATPLPPGRYKMRPFKGKSIIRLFSTTPLKVAEVVSTS